MSTGFMVVCQVCNLVVLHDVAQITAEHLPVLREHTRACAPAVALEDLGELLRYFDVHAM